MKTKKTVLYGILALILAAAFTACPNDSSEPTLTGITAVYTGGSVAINTNVNSLKSNLTVTANYSDNTGKTLDAADYSLSGDLSASGQKTVTVTYEGKTTNFNVTVSATPIDITYTVARADGEDGVSDTTGIVFTFSASVDNLNLTATDITIGGTAEKDAAELTGTGTTRTLAITVSSAGTATVTIDKTGIEAGTKNLIVFKAGESAPVLTGITAVYTGTAAIYPTTPLNSLKANLTVKAQYTGGGENTLSEHEYSLSGTLTVGTSIVNVTYTDSDGVTKTTTFDVTVTATPTGGGGTPGLAYELITSGANANTYRVRKGTVTGGVIVIPETYNGLPVTEIGSTTDDAASSAFGSYLYQNTTLTSITIPASVTTIGNEAFRFCTGLTSITIPEGVTTIGNGAFRFCSGFTGITIPDSVTTIGDGAFDGCTGITSITIPEGVMSIGNGAFSGFKNIIIDNDKLTFDSGRTLIHIFAPFPDSSVTFKKNVPDYAFDGTNNTYGAGLTSVTILEGVTSIGYRAFAGCPNLASIAIPASVTSIGDGAFGSCYGLTGITVDENNPNYASQDGILYNKAKTEIVIVPQGISGNVTIPESVTEIKGFYYCTSLTGITIPDSVTTIGNSAFSYCTGLVSVTIGEGVTSISNSAFSYCSSLASITLPNNVTTIGYSAFSYCTGLASVTIGEGVTSIDGQAFSGCTGLTGITIPEGVTSINNSAFSDCTNLKNIIIDNDKLTFTYNNSLLDKFPIDNLSVTFKKNVPAGAFYTNSYYSTRLSSVTILEGVTSIGNSAFYNCTGLTGITIPEGVTSIGSSAFYGSTGLTSIAIPEGVTSIGNYAFYDWTDSQTIYVNGYANQAAADAAWGTNWRYRCNAVIVYGIATEIVQLNRTVFLSGEQLDSIAATIRYSNNTTETAAIPAANISGFDSTTTGTKTLTVTYRSLTATFTVTVVDEMLITNTAEWNNAITQLNGANGSVTLTIGGSFNVAGSTVNTFGTTANGFALTVTLNGSGTLSLSSNGSMLGVGANQTLIIDSENLILQGRSYNNAPLVVVGTTAQLELRDGIITGNTYDVTTNFVYGGGVYVGGTFTMSGGTISNNTLRNEYNGGPEAYGGGVCVYGSGIFTMNGGTISGNSVITRSTNSSWQSRAYGGGVCVYGSGIFTMNGGTISGNTASATGSTSLNRAEGGGVNVYSSSSTFRITNGTIYGNNETTTSLRNTIAIGNGGSSSGAALYTYGTAQRGTFSIPGDITSEWNSAGTVSTTNNTIRVVNGALQ